MLICFEGLDGSGKSTQIRLLNQYLEEKNKQVESTFFPRNRDVFGLLIKDNEKYESNKLDLMLSSLMGDFETYVKPHADNKIVLLDRFVLSSFVYQTHLENSNDMLKQRTISKAMDYYKERYFLPDMKFIFIDVDKETRVNRLNKRTLFQDDVREILDSYSVKNHDIMREDYLMYLQSHSYFKDHIVIDGNQESNLIHQQIVEYLGV